MFNRTAFEEKAKQQNVEKINLCAYLECPCLWVLSLVVASTFQDSLHNIKPIKVYPTPSSTRISHLYHSSTQNQRFPTPINLSHHPSGQRNKKKKKKSHSPLTMLSVSFHHRRMHHPFVLKFIHIWHSLQSLCAWWVWCTLPSLTIPTSHYSPPPAPFTINFDQTKEPSSLCSFLRVWYEYDPLV